LGRKLQENFGCLKTFASGKPNFSPPTPSSFAAEITQFPVSYNFITISTPNQLIEFNNAPFLPSSGKGYINKDENWTTYIGIW
jgi:hypothetical protein